MSDQLKSKITAARMLMSLKRRSASGQALVVLMIFFSTLVILPIALFSYEYARYSLAQQQLQSCVQSAALAAGTGQAGSNTTDTTTTQGNAMSIALIMFQQNSILGVPLTSATSNGLQTGTPTFSPTANQATLAFQFLDPVTRQPVASGSPNGKIIKVWGAFGFLPVFGQFTHIASVVPIIATSNGGLPMLDVILCFDISGSMDDFTNISMVDRWIDNSGTNVYTILTQGPMYTAVKDTANLGTPLNATFPQSLDEDGGDYAYRWGSDGNGAGRGQNSGAPPPQGLLGGNQYTDMVVNIDGTSNESAGITVNGCVFPANNIGVLVEAARGNLENSTVAKAANVPYSTWGITLPVSGSSGYYAAYCQTALSQRHPIQDAITAAQNFYTIMNNDCDAHFGLVTFSWQEGSGPNSVVPGYGYDTTPGDNSTYTIPKNGNIATFLFDYTSNAYPTDPLSPMPPNPKISLNPTEGSAYNNYTAVNTAVGSLLAYGSTDIAGALQVAIEQMEPTSVAKGAGLARAGATKAILLFTDGFPDCSSYTPSSGNSVTDARLAAAQANTQGIPIYCIGLCLEPSLKASQDSILTDQDSNPSTGGIAGISGNGAQYYQATNAAQLNLVFEHVARSLVSLVH